MRCLEQSIVNEPRFLPPWRNIVGHAFQYSSYLE